MARPSRKNDVIAAAAELFAAGGFDGATVRDIAQVANMQAASVYRHFSSKQDLFDAVLHWVCENVKASRQSLLSADLPPEQKLKAFVRSVLAEHEANTIYRKIFYRALIEDRKEILETLVHKIHADQHYDLVNAIRNIDSEVDPYFALYTVLSLTIGYINVRPLQDIIRRLTSKERDPDHMANVILNMCFPRINWAEVPDPALELA